MARNTAKNTICLWYDKDAEAAARFYAETFPDSAVGAVHRAPSDYPSGKKGDVLTVEFTVAGVPCIGLNGGSTDPAHVGWFDVSSYDIGALIAGVTGAKTFSPLTVTVPSTGLTCLLGELYHILINTKMIFVFMGDFFYRLRPANRTAETAAVHPCPKFLGVSVENRGNGGGSDARNA